MVPILDAYSSLNLSTELLTEVTPGILLLFFLGRDRQYLTVSLILQVRQWVMSTLCAVDLEVVPVIVKFILHTVTPTDALEVSNAKGNPMT